MFSSIKKNDIRSTNFFILITILLVITALLASILFLNLNKSISPAFASTDGYPSLIEPDPCPGYVQPTSAYNKNNSEGVKFGNTWLGNTFCGSNNNGQPFNSFTSAINDIYVQPDGTVLTNAQFEESGKGLGAWKDGKVAFDDVFYQKATTSGNAITGDGTGNISFFPRANGGSGNTLVVGFGNSYAGSGPQLSSANEILAIKGMAAQNGILYTAKIDSNSVKKYSYTSPTGGLTDLNQGWSIPANSTKLVFDKNNTLWLLNDPYGTNPKITQYDTNGNQLKQFSFPTGIVPTAITFDVNNKLYVGDSGADQQIKIYDISGSSLVQTETFGVQFGTTAGPIKGQTGPLRFRGGFSGLGFDASNNLYISTSAGNDTTLSSYNFSTQVRNWFLESNQFQKIVSADPGSDNGDKLNMFSPNLKTKFDFSKPKGKQFNVSAQIEDYDSSFNKATKTVVPRFAYTTRINSQKFNYLDDDDNGGNSQLLIRRQTTDSGEIGVDSAAVSCDNNRLNLWTDLNNNHSKDANEIVASPTNISGCNSGLYYYVDENSGIWYYQAGSSLEYLPLQGLDSNGVPIYSWTSAKHWGNQDFPAGLNAGDPQIDYGYYSFHYDAKKDIAIFRVNTQWPSELNGYKNGPNKVVVIDNWLKGNKAIKWQSKLPMDNCSCFFRTHASIAGDLFMVNNNFDADYRVAGDVNIANLNARAGRTYIWDINTGTYLGVAMPDTDLFKTTQGFVDAEYQTMGYQRNNGEILNFVEDVWETKTRITQIQSPMTRLTSANSINLPDRDNMGIRILNPLTPQVIPQGTANLTASASIKEGTVSKVEFFAKDVTNPSTINPLEIKIGEDTNGSDGWSYSWDTSGLALGNKYQVYTRASGVGTPVVNTSEPFILQISNIPIITSSSTSSSSLSSTSSSSTINTSSSSSSSSATTTSSSSSSSLVSSAPSSTSSSSNTSVSTITSSSTTSSTTTTNVANAIKITNPLNIVNTNNDFSSSTSYNVDKLILGATSAVDLSASFKPMWDNQNLYLSYNVTDDIVNPTGSPTNTYDKDGIEVMLNLNNTKTNSYDGVDDCKYSFPLSGINEVYTGTNSNCSLAGVQSSFSLINGVYRMDIKIPFSSIGITTISDNQKIGFDTQINDNDNGNNRESIISFNALDSNTIWNTPSTWGEMILLPLNTNSSSTTSSTVSTSSTSSTTSSINSNDCLI